jgi:hypothetical protein
MKPRVGLLLSALVTAAYFSFVLILAFRPQLLPGYRGLTLSLWFIVLTLVVMGGYSWWRISRIDE